ncbi:MAG TPA: M23 family metallopeptidase, partial [Candidatus Anoxymicrobiaceae bacterium]
MPSSNNRTAALAALALMFIPFLVLVPVARLRAAPGGFAWPVTGEVLRGFEKPSGPYGQGGHQGVDIAATPGETVASAQDGKVQWVGELPRGRFVTIVHYGGVRATYLDLDAIEVSTGQRVARGQPIGTVRGHRDDSSPAPHLHFDTYFNGSPADPMLLLRGVD